ncbi:MAG: hypothetical protein WBM41_04490 [Arenicellales bacterium]
MVDRISALDGHYQSGRFGTDGDTDVGLQLIRDLQLQQVAAWPDTIKKAADAAAKAAGADEAPAPGKAISGERGAILRSEPLKWWLVGVDSMQIDSGQGAVLDLSHSRTQIRITGPKSTTLLNRLLPLDLRDTNFREGAVASSAMHHVGVTLWHSASGYELFIPRGFALSIWEILFESALQFGVEVV